jgi:hypothetical protein
MYLGSATLLTHVVPVGIASVCMTIKTLEVEVPHILFAVGGFSTSNLVRDVIRIKANKF